MVSPKKDPSDVDRARRYFLKAGVYAAPAIVATIQLRRAHAQGPSCMPVTCMPATCMPISCMPLTCMPLN
ncbi:MAG: hypothetical protein WBG86_02675 [Polyangiales bacterium]